MLAAEEKIRNLLGKQLFSVALDNFYAWIIEAVSFCSFA